MSIPTFVKRSTFAMGTLSLLSVMAIAPAAQAASVNLNTWSIIGDGITTPSSATVTNQFINSDGSSPDDDVRINVSGQEPLTVFSTPELETSLGLVQGAFKAQLGGVDIYEGSAIRNTAFAATAGDVFSFNWNFPIKDANDIGFVKINSTLSKLTGSSPFSYTFGGSGVYDIAIGVVDAGDFSYSSKLEINNAQTSAAVPTPALLPGLLGLAIGAFRKRESAVAG